MTGAILTGAIRTWIRYISKQRVGGAASASSDSHGVKHETDAYTLDFKAEKVILQVK